MAHGVAGPPGPGTVTVTNTVVVDIEHPPVGPPTDGLGVEVPPMGPPLLVVPTGPTPDGEEL